MGFQTIGSAHSVNKGHPVLSFKCSLPAFSSKCLWHVFLVLNKHHFCLGHGFCQYKLKMCRPFFFFFLSSLTACLINLPMESTAQFAVCCLLSSHYRVKTLFKKVQNTCLRLFCFPERKKARGKNPCNHSEFDLIAQTSF